MIAPVYFFLGVDPAPSDNHRSDEGALTVGAARPRFAMNLPEKQRRRRRWDEEEEEFEISDNPNDWFFDYCFARVFNAKHKLSSEQWAGYIHGLHRRFGFQKIVLDPGGGGIYLKRALMNDEQEIGGVRQKVTPLCDQVDGPRRVVRGEFIVHLMKRGDPGVELVWPNPDNTDKSLAGDELLKDALLSSYKDGLEGSVIGLPGDPKEWLETRREEVTRWPEEKMWALKNLHAGGEQLKGIIVQTKEDGTQVFNRRGARLFQSLGRDDIAFSMIYCYAAFLIWLKSDAWRESREDEDEEAFVTS